MVRPVGWEGTGRGRVVESSKATCGHRASRELRSVFLHCLPSRSSSFLARLALLPPFFCTRVPPAAKRGLSSQDHRAATAVHARQTICFHVAGVFHWMNIDICHFESLIWSSMFRSGNPSGFARFGSLCTLAVDRVTIHGFEFNTSFH
jgi:hypothetical protein